MPVQRKGEGATTPESFLGKYLSCKLCLRVTDSTYCAQSQAIVHLCLSWEDGWRLLRWPGGGGGGGRGASCGSGGGGGGGGA